MFVKVNGKQFERFPMAAAYAVCRRQLKLKKSGTTAKELTEYMRNNSDIGEARVGNAGSWLADAYREGMLDRKRGSSGFIYWAPNECMPSIAPDLLLEACRKEQIPLPANPSGATQGSAVDVQDMFDRVRRLEDAADSNGRQFKGLWKRTTEMDSLVRQVKSVIADYENRMAKYANGKGGGDGDH
jgi:hypothetical protein